MSVIGDPELLMFDALASMLRTVDQVLAYSDGHAPVRSSVTQALQARLTQHFFTDSQGS